MSAFQSIVDQWNKKEDVITSLAKYFAVAPKASKGKIDSIDSKGLVVSYQESPTDKTRKDVHIMFPKQLSDKSKIQSALDSFQKEATAALSLNPDKSYKTPKLPHEIFQPPPSSAVQIAVLFYTFLAVWYAYCLRFSAVDPRILPKEVIPYRRFLADPAVFKSLATAVFAMNGAMALVAFGLTVFMARMPFKYVIKWVVSVIFFGLLQLRGCVKTSVKLGGILEQWHELTIS